MGVGTLGFLKGASTQVLSSLEARDTAERELKKQKELEKFRADLRQQEEMAKATTFQMEKDPETGKMKTVGYNSQNQRLDGTVRDATQSELDAQKQGEEDRGWTLKERVMKEKDFAGDETERAQRMRLDAARDARDAGTSALDSQYKRTLIAGAGGKGGKANLSEVMDSIMTRNSKAIQELSGQEGVPLSDIQAGAWRFAEQRVAKGDSPLELERNFTNYLTELRREAQKRGTRLDRYKQVPKDSSTNGW